MILEVLNGTLVPLTASSLARFQIPRSNGYGFHAEWPPGSRPLESQFGGDKLRLKVHNGVLYSATKDVCDVEIAHRHAPKTVSRGQKSGIV